MWESLSDRNSKTDVGDVNDESILSTIATLPIRTWRYKSEKTDVGDVNDESVLSKIATLPVRTWRYKSEAGVRHVGPMAQDFYAAFGVGEDDRHLNSIDEDGIAFSAIKALHRENAQLRSELRQLRSEMQRVEAKLRSRPSP